MALDERARHHLYQRLEEQLGPEAASTLMEHLPPVGWADVATKRDLDHLSSDIERMGDQLRGEFYKAMTESTRTILFANLGTALAVTTLAFAAARLT